MRWLMKNDPVGKIIPYAGFTNLRALGRVVILIACLGWDRGILLAEDTPVQPPFARVPKVAIPPSIDKSLSMAGSWLDGAGFSGMVDVWTKSYVGWVDAGWWLAYDDQNLYIGCLTYCSDPKTRFLSSVKANDDQRIVGDDHLEIQLSFEERSRAGGQPFYKIMVNPRGAVSAAIINFLPGQDKYGWAGRLQVATHLQQYAGTQWWATKMAIPLEVFELKSLDGKKATVHFVYSPTGQGVYCGWVAGTWMDWQKFGELHFDPHAPGYQINSVFPGTLIDPKGGIFLDAAFKPNSGTQTSSARVQVRNQGDDQMLYEKTAVIEGLKGGERKGSCLREAMPVSDDANRFSVEMTWSSGGQPQEVLYRAHIPFRKSDERLEQQIDTWRKKHLAQRDARANLDFAYFPSFHKLRVTVDSDIDLETIAPEQKAKGEAIRKADAFRAKVLNIAKKELASAHAALGDHKAEKIIDLPSPLPPGKYTLQVDMLNDGRIADTSTMAFVREKFPWEHNPIGLDKVVIPPYRPIEVQGTTIKVWGREYAMAPNGFFSQVHAEGRPLLGGPITLVATVDGKECKFAPDGNLRIQKVAGQTFPADFIQHWYKATCPNAELQPTDGYQAKVSASGRLGALTVRLEGTMEYEGWYTVNLTIEPQGKVSCSRLDLVVPFSDQADLMRFCRDYDTHGYGAIPPGEGVLFESTKLEKSASVTGSFVPRVYVGNYSRGLWWCADSARGWIVDDAVPLAQLERRTGQVLLRLRLVNTPAIIEKPRAIQFAFQAAPMKPRPPQYRQIAWKYPEEQFAHDTSGYRYYGNGVCGCGLYTEEDYQGLKKFFYEMDIDKNHVRPSPTGYCKMWWGMHWLRPARKGYPLVEYGNTWLNSAALKEFPTFMGEWTYTNDWGKFFPDESYRNVINYGGTYQWKTDAQCIVFSSTHNQSYEDMLIWHMTRMGAKAGLNGTFYDCYTDSVSHLGTVSINTDIAGDAWYREDGKLQWMFCPFRRHFYTKRFATAFWLMGRPPFQLVAWEPDISFAEASWFIEGIWYLNSPSVDFIEQGLSPDLFQASTCKPGQLGYIWTTIPPFIGADGKPAGYNVRAQRIMLAYCLLNDLGCVALGYAPLTSILQKLESEVVFFAGARFLPYWENIEWLKPNPKGVLISGYVHPEKKKVVFVVLNPTEKSVDLSLRLDGQHLLGRPLQSVNDFETGKALKVEGGQVSGISLGRHEVVLLLAQ